MYGRPKAGAFGLAADPKAALPSLLARNAGAVMPLTEPSMLIIEARDSFSKLM